MNDRELEDLMREYEAEVAAYKRLPQAEPTALLDRAVLTKARAAVGPVHKPPRWIALAASFAGVAIAAGIGWRVYEVQESARGEAMLDGARAREETFEVEVLPSSSRDRAKALEMAQLPPPPAKPEPQAFNEAKREQQAQPAAAEPVLADSAELPASEASPVPAAPAAQRGAAIEADKRADHSSRAAVPEQRQNLAAPAATAAAAAPGMDLGAVAADEKDAAAERIDADRETGAGRTLKQDLAARDAWLERIRRLVRDRRHGEARAELARFRTAYPDAVIPPDLRRFLP